MAKETKPESKPQAVNELVPPALLNRKTTDETRRRYWVGTLAVCPIKDVHLGGVCFPRFTGRIEIADDGAVDYSASRRGGLIALTQGQVAAIRKALATKIVRGNAIFSTQSPGYFVLEEDKPLAEFVYMVAEDEAAQVLSSAQWREKEPPSLLVMESPKVAA